MLVTAINLLFLLAAVVAVFSVIHSCAVARRSWRALMQERPSSGSVRSSSPRAISEGLPWFVYSSPRMSMLCHLKAGLFAWLVFRRKSPRLVALDWREGFGDHGRAQRVHLSRSATRAGY